MKLVDQDIPGPRRDYVGYGARPPMAFWPNDAKAVVSLCINQEEGSEYSKAAGDDRNSLMIELKIGMVDSTPISTLYSPISVPFEHP